MIIKRRTTMRWGYRLGAGVAYFTDPELGAARRHETLLRLDALIGSTPAGPMIAWLAELNEGRLGPPPSREAFQAGTEADMDVPEEAWAEEDAEDYDGQAAGEPTATDQLWTGAEDEPADHEATSVDDLTVIEHQHTQ